jgi:transcription initiation factor TFIIIB Brf1 subunit/transcription initiation factor TFIIB
MKTIVLRKPLLLARGQNLPICPQCEKESMLSFLRYRDNCRCTCCGLVAEEAIVFRIKETQNDKDQQEAH